QVPPDPRPRARRRDELLRERVPDAWHRPPLADPCLGCVQSRRRPRAPALSISPRVRGGPLHRAATALIRGADPGAHRVRRRRRGELLRSGEGPRGDRRGGGGRGANRTPAPRTERRAWVHAPSRGPRAAPERRPHPRDAPRALSTAGRAGRLRRTAVLRRVGAPRDSGPGVLRAHDATVRARDPRRRGRAAPAPSRDGGPRSHRRGGIRAPVRGVASRSVDARHGRAARDARSCGARRRRHLARHHAPARLVPRGLRLREPALRSGRFAPRHPRLRPVRAARIAAGRPDGAARAPARPAREARVRSDLPGRHPAARAVTARGAAPPRGDGHDRCRRPRVPRPRALLLARAPAPPPGELARPLTPVAAREPGRRRRRAPERPVNETARFFGALFAAYERRHIRYAVLRNYEGWPDDYGKDVDLVVHPDDLARSHSLVLRLANLYGLGAAVRRRRDAHVFYRLVPRDGDPDPILLDCRTDLVHRGFVYLPGTAVLASRRRHDGFYVPSPAVESLALLLHVVIHRRAVRPSYRARLRQ